ncbi:MAG: membrane-bound lytic murein transglycosylase MltF [Natronospirillum sp.]|uniref:membrane-bound lytic murein transglycosylase MltF n=1 Tax=Natronospirillum sp. TaxID=2812955 RepID=UPI0025E44CE2|nr:membrane-bound lytic murein transglycosylase MltF [Natronospirillum sp.]MCH8550458.1 membrane-bound lytic murein transglycosylase MltF [Natronospirillum sp.]
MHILARQRLLKRTIIWACVGLITVTVFLFGFSRIGHMDTIERAGELRVVIANDPRHFNAHGDTLEMTLARKFTDHLGLELRFHTVDSQEELRRALRLGLADMAVGGIVVPDLGQGPPDMVYSRPYMDVLQQVVYKSNSLQVVDELPALQGAVRANTAQYRALRTLAIEQPLDIQVVNGTTEAVLKALGNGEADYAVIDSNDHAYYRPFYPSLRHAFDISAPQPVAWKFYANKDGSLRAAANNFLDHVEATGQLEIVLDQHLGHLREFDYVGVRRFERHVNTRLPPLRDFFEAGAEETGLDWRLLAAVGYQESHWRADAVSPTGVRGVMMLTLRTSGELGVTNRLDPEQSVRGGARYLAGLYGRVPDNIEDPDRLWFALAAYNVGMGHVMDARRIAAAVDEEADYWTDLREYLPLLRDPDYYRFTRYGFARGDEPVVYVQNIRRYYDLLRWMFPTEDEAELLLPGLEPDNPGIVLPPLLQLHGP